MGLFILENYVYFLFILLVFNKDWLLVYGRLLMNIIKLFFFIFVLFFMVVI